MFCLPFVWAVHYALKGKVNPYMNLPWKLVLARTGAQAIHKFNKRHPKYEAVFVMKI
jgi:hypothetical protein